MKKHAIIWAYAFVVIAATSLPGVEPEQRVNHVAETKGLVAFWYFSLMQDGKWTSYHDDDVVKHGFPVVLRRIGDPNPYKPEDWPHTPLAQVSSPLQNDPSSQVGPVSGL